MPPSPAPNDGPNDGPGAGTPSPRRTRSRRGEGARLRDEILDATEAILLGAHDLDEVTIRGVAAAVGVSAPAIYRHFTDRAELLIATCERRFAAFDDYLEAAVAAATDPFDELQRRGRAYIHFALENPEVYRLLFMDPPTELHWGGADVREGPGGAAFVHFLDNLERAMASGAIARGDTFLVACTAFACLHGVATALIGMPTFPWPPTQDLIDATSRLLANALVAGVQPLPPAAASRP